MLPKEKKVGRRDEKKSQKKVRRGLNVILK